MYGEGGAEEVVGEAIQGQPSCLCIVTKVYLHNASRKKLPESASAASNVSASIQLISGGRILLRRSGSIAVYCRFQIRSERRRIDVSNFWFGARTGFHFSDMLGKWKDSGQIRARPMRVPTRLWYWQ
jgi:hypothetical protein